MHLRKNLWFFTTKIQIQPLGKILLAADEIGLIGVWFENQKYYASGLKEPIEKETAVLKETKEWLNLYFSGKEPKVFPKMHLIGT